MSNTYTIEIDEQDAEKFPHVVVEIAHPNCETEETVYEVATGEVVGRRAGHVHPLFAPTRGADLRVFGIREDGSREQFMYVRE